MKTPSSKVDSGGSPPTRMPGVIRPGKAAVIFDDLREVLLERRSDIGL